MRGDAFHSGSHREPAHTLVSLTETDDQIGQHLRSAFANASVSHSLECLTSHLLSPPGTLGRGMSDASDLREAVAGGSIFW